MFEAETLIGIDKCQKNWYIMKFFSKLLSLLMFCNQYITRMHCLNFHYGKQGTKQAMFERFNNTCGGPTQPIIFTYTGMRVEGNNLILNTTITVKEDILTDPKLVVAIDRCQSKENLDSCEHFYDYKMDHYCWLVNTYTPLWGPFYETYVPKWKCPLKKGFYRSTNSTIDTSALLLYPLDAYYWKVRTETLDRTTNRIIMCLLVEARIITKN